MERSQIAELIRQVNATYPNAKPVTPIAEPIWIEDLAELEAADVRAAFAVYRRAGHAFPPGSADLRRVVLELQEPTPRFEVAWAAIHCAVRLWGSYREAKAQEQLKSTPMAWSLVLAMGGWRDICLGGPSEYQPTDPGVWRSQAEHAFRALLTERQSDRAAAAIPSALPGVRVAAARLDHTPAGQAALPAAAGEVAPAQPMQRLTPPSMADLRGMVAKSAARSAVELELKPEYRSQIEALIRSGQEAKVPERWRPFVPEIKAALEGDP